MKRILFFILLFVLFYWLIGFNQFNSQSLLVVNWLVPFLLTVFLIWELFALKLNLKKPPIVFNTVVILGLSSFLLFNIETTLKTENTSKQKTKETAVDSAFTQKRNIIAGPIDYKSFEKTHKHVDLPKTADFTVKTPEQYHNFLVNVIEKDYKKHIGKTVLMKCVYKRYKTHLKNQALLGQNRYFKTAGVLAFSIWGEFPVGFSYENEKWVELYGKIDVKQTRYGKAPIIVAEKVNKIVGEHIGKTGCNHKHHEHHNQGKQHKHNEHHHH